MSDFFENLRNDFPILQRTIHGKPFVYLDSAATTLKPESVVEALDGYYREYSVNIHRAVYELSEVASAAYEDTRKAIAEFFHVPEDYTVVFTGGSTDAANMLAGSWDVFLKSNEQIVLTQLEHHSNLIPWQACARRTGATLRYLTLNDDSSLCMEAIEEMLDTPTSVVAMTGMSNVTGYMPAVQEICQYATQRGIITCVDGAQLAGHNRPDISQLGCDFFFCSAHKLYGPTGIGCLIGRSKYMERIRPFRYGGGMIKEVKQQESNFASLPQRLEGGTPHIAGAIGFHAALRYLNAIPHALLQEHEQGLLRVLRDKLSELPYVHIWGPSSSVCALCSFTVEGVHPHDIASALDTQGVAVRTGHHCAQLLMKFFHIPGAIRVSFGVYNRQEDIDIFITALEKAYNLFR